MMRFYAGPRLLVCDLCRYGDYAEATVRVGLGLRSVEGRVATAGLGIVAAR
jgi:hypothetical protein